MRSTPSPRFGRGKVCSTLAPRSTVPKSKARCSSASRGAPALAGAAPASASEHQKRVRIFTAITYAGSEHADAFGWDVLGSA